MESILKSCRISLQRIYPSVCLHQHTSRTHNLTFINALTFNTSNNIFSTGSSIRSICQSSQYCASVKGNPRSSETSSTTDNQTTKTARSLAQELLATKLKEDANKQKFNSDFEADEKEKQEDNEKARRTLRLSLIASGLMTVTIGGSLLYSWGSPPEDEDGNVVEDKFSSLPVVEQYLRRFYSEIRNVNKVMQEPSREKLLPDTLTGEYYQPPYTLVLEVKDVLVHPEWTYRNGWRFKKRPGLEFLLKHCAPPLFEIVIYTNEQGQIAFPMIDKLDPIGYIWYRLFRDATHYIDGKHVKELGRLNRDLKRVIMVDWDGDAVSCPRNQLKIPRWEGGLEDKGLVQLAQLLSTIAETEVDDVREVLDYYSNHSDPLEAFTRYQAEALELEKENQNVDVKATWAPSFLKKW